MADVASLSLPFFGIIFIGYLAGKIKALPEAGLAWMNMFIIYVALPALFFQLISKTPFEELTNWRFVMTTTAVTIAMFTISFVFARLTRSVTPEASIQAVMGSYSNIGYMGPGLTLAVFGPAAAVPTALIFSFDNTFFFVAVPVLMAIAGAGGESAFATARTIAAKVCFHPFILSTVAGILAAYWQLVPPEPVDRMLTTLMGAAGPCALFVLGVTVSLRPLKRVPLALGPLLLLKLVVHPLAVYLALSYVGGFERIWVLVAVLMAALPPALNVFVLAQQYGAYVERASAGVLIGTLASTGTVTFWLLAITRDWLPAAPF